MRLPSKFLQDRAERSGPGMRLVEKANPSGKNFRLLKITPAVNILGWPAPYLTQ